MSDDQQFKEKLKSALQEAASRAFGDPVTARTWMQTPLATFGYRAPLDVAVESHSGEIRVKRDLLQIKSDLNM